MAAPGDIFSGLSIPAIGGNGVTSNAGLPVDTSGFGSFTTFGNGSGFDLSSLTGAGSSGSGSPLSSFSGGGGSGLGGGSTPVLDAFGNPTDGSGSGSGSGLVGMGGSLMNASFLSDLSGGSGGMVPNEGAGMAPQGGSGMTPQAQGNVGSQGPSAMSQLFGAIGNLFQRAGLIVLGVVLIGIGVYFLARPALERAGAKVAKAAAAVA